MGEERNNEEMYNDDISKRQKVYYESYYRDTLGLRNFKDNVSARFDEEQNEVKRLNFVSTLFSYDYSRKKVLVVGTGTGGAVVALNKLGCRDIYGIEPNLMGLDITKNKARLVGLSDSHFTNNVAENLPFQSNFFDFVYCFTVLEHVQDVRCAIEEMCRVVKPGGIVYINTPNYNYPFEGHYKCYAPTFLGKTVTKFYLKLLGRNSVFIDTLQFVTKRSVDKILMTMPEIYYLRFIENNITNSSSVGLMKYFIVQVLNLMQIEKKQQLFIIKRDNEDNKTSNC